MEKAIDKGSPFESKNLLNSIYLTIKFHTHDQPTSHEFFLNENTRDILHP